MTEQERLAAGLRYLEQQKRADPLESFRSLKGLKDAYERRVQPIINNAMQTFETGGAVGDLLRAYGSAAAPANAAVLEGMGMPYRGPMTAPRQEGVSSGENFRAMGDPRQQAVGQMIGDPANLAQPVGARLANALKFAKPDAMKMVQEMSRGAISPMDVWHGSPHRFPPTAKNPLGEFDPAKIGTGEGAQAYGYGHYLAENPSIANSYANQLGKFIDRIQTPNGVMSLEDALTKHHPGGGSTAKLMGKLRNKLDVDSYNSYIQDELVPEMRVAMNLPKEQWGEVVGKAGTIYKVDLPDEHIARMLDWDKPISQQNEAIQKVFPHFSAPEARALTLEGRQLRQQANDLFSAGKLEEAKSVMNRAVATEARMLGAMGRDEMTGQDLHGKIASLLGSSAKEIGPGAYDFGSKATSKMLYEMGVPGIQYLDAGSRGAGTGTRNFVVFPGNEGLLNILGRE